MAKVLELLSRRNWGILRYNSIFQNLMALMYLAIAGQQHSLNFLGRTISFFLFSIFMTGYGYFINDLSDIELDRLHGKPNAFLHTRLPKAIFIVVTFLAAGILCAFPFLDNPWFLAWLAAWILCVSFYSLQPLRLKEKGFAGLMATVLGQQTLPTLLLLTGFTQSFDWIVPLFILYSTVRGISSDLSHQIRDWENDVKTRTRTFAVQLGRERSDRIYAVCLEVERVVLGCSLVGIMVRIPGLRVAGLSIPFSPVWILVILYLSLLMWTAGRSWQANKNYSLRSKDPYDEARQSQTMDALHLIHHTFPTVIIPLYLGMIASLEFAPHGLFILAIILLYRLYRPELWYRIAPWLHLSKQGR